MLEELVADERLKRLVTVDQSAPFPDLHRTIDDLVAEGDKVVVRQTIRGTHRGEYLGVPPTGKPVTFTAVAIFRLADGRIVESWILRDDLSILQQLSAAADPRP